MKQCGCAKVTTNKMTGCIDLHSFFQRRN